MPKVIKDEAKCTNCGTCVEVCPAGVFEKRDDKVVVVNPDACVLCRACEAQCSAQALTIEE
jgi:NAD-dependent dihydropyrimidine dehydrogenase PreA subunit